MKKLCVFLASLLLVGIQMVQAQTVRITGTVTSSEDGMPLPGVSVIVKGTTIGGATDVNGKYEINVPTDAQALTFSFIGFKVQDVTIGGRSVVDVALESESVQVQEVVVTALGIKREKREVTYQTQKVASDELTKIAPTKAATALAGKVAGLQINVQDNGVNPSVQILLRGMRSVSANNSALIVIDGAIASEGAFSALNPNDIANISVL
ncbi:MAG TPA: carboxypeptidase-like regulatory domain-containing protein, partial [Tenuifilaceae bacterium]|nr:carboxypeptidase-like regulatory domain-containing protein [Tenuifilaceae bacterium]